MKTQFFYVLMLLSSFSIFAQNGNLTGSISDENGLPLPGANILVNETEYYATTDFDGKFTILNILEGNYKVEISYVGYENFTKEFTIASGITETLIIQLNPITTQLGEVVVTSTLSGQTRALATQKNNTNITNVVSADQMGKYPDSNIGESVRRIPGVTIQNDQGEARNIIIRGMAPQLNSVTINGERIPSAEAETRSIQMDLIPADMIQTVQVNKAVTPDMDADAIGGSVNLVTRTAPSKQRLSATLASGVATFDNKPLYNAALVYGNRFADDKLGVVVSGSYNDVDYGSDNVEFEHGGIDTDNDDVDDDTVLEDYQIRQYFVQRIRKSVSANVDYRISNNHSIFLKGIYNHRNDFENRFRLRFKDLHEDEYTIERQTKGGGKDNKNTRLEDQKMWNVQLGGEHLFNTLKMNWSVSTSEASEDRPNERYVVYRNRDLDIATADFSNYVNNNNTGYITTSGGEETAYDDMSLKEITEEHQYTDEKDLNAKLDFELPVSNLSNIKFGARLRTKEKTRNNDFYEYEDENDLYESMTTSGVSIKDYTNADYLAGSQYQAGSFATPNFLANLNLSSADFNQVDLLEEYVAGNYNASEDIYGGYAMYEGKISNNFDVIVGARFEYTDIEYAGFSFDAETEVVGNTAGTKDYSNFLPNVQLKYELSKDMFLRAAYTNTIARPDYYDLVPYEASNSEDEEVEFGNINLEAATASNFDLMFESYFGKYGLVSAGVFTKKINDFIYESTYDINDSNSIYNGYEATQKRNGKEADVFGFELAFQSDLSFISSSNFFKNLNFYSNYTYTDTKTNGVAGREDDIALPGTAGNMVNGSLTYDNNKFMIKVSANYTSDYIDEYGDFSLLDRYYDEQFFLDVNASFNINKHLNVFASATNLTNQELRYYQGVKDMTMQMEYYGLRVNLGLKYNL